MNEGKIAVRYARALYNLAKEEKIVDEIKSDFEKIRNLISESPEFKYFIVDPIAKQSNKKEVFNLIFAKQVNTLTLQFLNLIVKNKREQYLNHVVRVFLEMYKKDVGIKSVTLTTAIPVSDTIKESISKYIADKLKIKLELEEKVEEKIIGGFILKIDNQQIDASVSSGLKKIKKELLNR